ncbi:hypothetical protein HYH03_017075 [Edaphochlamys debaryana]|uniref:Uncharacterized protein n=1 Tax=Edaphochlamys debaryana TaxID=47281 RepID=A0A835XIQ0_9CHLO|nr:hypothetical protein HYH03_017075 [Edaphochlamys debaryana]|eukprot:KAG2484125.1 hypothetical protein HYH03_017075 [Edaphochlamys debaryana]
MFVYDVTKPQTLEDLERLWIPSYNKHGPEGAVKIIVGNKADLSTSRQVSSEEGHDFARRHGCLFVETSAQDNTAVGQAFEELLANLQPLKALAIPAPREEAAACADIMQGRSGSQDANTAFRKWARRICWFPWLLFERGA